MASLRARVLLIASVCLLLAAAAPVPARAAQEVGYPVLLQQIKSGPLIRAVINRKGGDIEIKFRNLSEWKAFYPPGAQPMLQRLLHERHIPVIFASRHHHAAKPRAVHHHLRYIAAGVLGALALVGGVLLLVQRRRRTRAPLREDTATS
jgi:hypothetical protein